MKVYIPGSCFLLLILQVTVAAETCENDWWGPKCEFLCFCEDNVACNEHGECENNKCTYHHFGPSCQYEDVLSWDYKVAEEYLYDFRDETCSDTHSTKLEVVLNKDITFTWYRIVVKNANAPLNFNTTLNGKEQCWNERKFEVDSKTIDVTCDTEITLHTLRIDGHIVQSVCGLYINLGRNVALKQKTEQSCTDETDLKKAAADNAVDDVVTDFEGGSCAQTCIDKDGPEWSVTFKEPTRLHYINVQVGKDNMERHSSFKITLYDQQNKLVDSHIALNIIGDNKDMYQFQINKSTAVNSIHIKQSLSIPLKIRYLTLCEVKAFGDPECPNNKFGILCEDACACKSHEACSYVTGACAPGCPTSYYGFNCSQHCALHCPNRTCNPYTGHCQPCTGGFVGSRCEIECDPGTYGDDKICRKCSPGCIEICNILDGRCSCKSGFEGERCQNCKLGTYFLENMCVNCHYGCDVMCDNVTGYCNVCKDGFTGLRCSDCAGNAIQVNCNFNCSKGCDHRCNIVDGLCSCDIDFKGPLCSECETSYYGTRCDLNCPEHCVNKTCFRANGTCPACEGGFSGKKCDDSGIMPFEWILAMLFVADTVIVLCCLFICMIFRKKKHSLADDEE